MIFRSIIKLFWLMFSFLLQVQLKKYIYIFTLIISLVMIRSKYDYTLPDSLSHLRFNQSKILLLLATIFYFIFDMESYFNKNCFTFLASIVCHKCMFLFSFKRKKNVLILWSIIKFRKLETFFVLILYVVAKVKNTFLYLYW